MVIADAAESWALNVGLVFMLGFIFFGSAVYALVWARRQKQFDDLEKSSRSIFDEDEPEGVVTDTYPGAKDQTSAGAAARTTR